MMTMRSMLLATAAVMATTSFASAADQTGDTAAWTSKLGNTSNVVFAAGHSTSVFVRNDSAASPASSQVAQASRRYVATLTR